MLFEMCSERCSERIGVVLSLYCRIHKQNNGFADIQRAVGIAKHATHRRQRWPESHFQTPTGSAHVSKFFNPDPNFFQI